MRKNRAMTHRVAVLALEHVVAFDLGVPPQVLNAARESADRALYDVRICGTGPVRSTAGFTVTPDHDLSLLATAGTVIVPGVGAGRTVTDGTVPSGVAAALRAAHERGARMVSICTGARVLAAAGLLDGRPAASHWAWSRRLRRLYPQVRVGLRRAVRGRRQRPHLGWCGRRRGPLPAHGAHRPRQRGGEPGRPALRGAGLAGRGPGAVHRAAGARRPAAPATEADPGLGAAAGWPSRSASRRWRGTRG